MRHIFVSLAAFCALGQPALAEPLAAHPQPTPRADGPADGPKSGTVNSAQARSEDLFRRVNQRSAAAIRSICLGCNGPATVPKAALHKPARATPTDFDEAE